MPELELNPVKEEDFVKKILNRDFSTKNKETKDTKENIDECYNIIENILNDKTDKYEGLKKFLGLLNDTIESVDQSKYDNETINDLKKVLAESKKEVNKLIKTNPKKEEISSIIDTIMIKIESLLIDKNKKDEIIHIDSVDKAYEKLYNAMEEKDEKSIRLCRGRLIRVLKKEKNTINQLYEKVKTLVKIDELLEENNLDKIKEILLEEENKELYNKLQKSLNSIEEFKNAFEKEYIHKQVKRVLLYYNALSEELRIQKEDYKKRYDKNFLGKNGNILTTVKSFPEALAISVKNVANSIDELKEAKTGRMKAKKFLETLGAIGKVIATPVIAAGKFVASNWYTLLQLYKGPYQAYKKKQETESNNKIQKQDNISEEKQDNIQDKNEHSEDEFKTDTNTQTTNDSQEVNEIKSEEKVENQTDNQQKIEENPSVETKVEIDPNKKYLCMIEDKVTIPNTIFDFYQMTDLEKERLFDAYKNGQISSAQWPDFLPKPDDLPENFPKVEHFPEELSDQVPDDVEPVAESETNTTPSTSINQGRVYIGISPIGPFVLTDPEFDIALTRDSDLISSKEFQGGNNGGCGGGRHR